MAKTTDKGKRPAKSKEKGRRNAAVAVLPIKKGASLKAIYAAAHRAFTAADLQKYTEIEAGIPARQVLADLEAVDRSEAQKRRRESTNGRSR